MADDFAADVAGISALAEPARRALYLYVVGQSDPVSRDQAAQGVDLPRHTAKFHLDRLVDAGLLEVEFRRLTGRQGPGAGRPAKLYRRSSRDVSVSLPVRRYGLAGEILASAMERLPRSRKRVSEAVASSARKAGQQTGAEARASGIGAEARTALESLLALLAAHGYEPRREGDTVVLANCPFHELSRQHTELVCGMNAEFIGGLCAGLGHESFEPRLDPGADRCCVTLTAVN
jgi:predicted ArsR family transcriptional regulator